MLASWLESETSGGSWAIFSLTLASLEAALSNAWIDLISSSGSGASLAEWFGERMMWTSFFPSLSNWTTSFDSDFFPSFFTLTISSWVLFSLVATSRVSLRASLATGSPALLASCLLLKLVSAIYTKLKIILSWKMKLKEENKMHT